jgi:hypothetical protein
MITFYDAKTDEPLPFSPNTVITGWLPMMLDDSDPRPAKEQFDWNYQHGGGWRPYDGFRYTPRALYHPGDPPQPCVAYATLRNETIRLYRNSWVAIEGGDGSVAIARMD